MANKKISELDVRASLTLADLLVVGDPSTGYAYKITVNDLKTVTGAGVISFNGRVGAVVPTEGDYSLTQLSDTIITSAVADQLLKYNGSNWVNWTPNYLTAESDTLDSVTDRGNTTTNGITVGTMDVTGVLTGGDTIKSTNGTVTTSMSYGASAGIIGTTSNHSLEIRTNNVYRIGVNTSGVVNVSNLAGTGTRMVVTDAAGNLSSQAIPSGTVTSVGLSTGTTGTDVNVTGSPVTSSGSITLNIPDASATARGLITTGSQTIAGAKTFSGIAYFNNVVYLPNNTFDGSAAAFGGNNTATYLFGSYTYAYYKNIFNTAWSAGVLSNNPTAYLTTNLFLQRAITAPSTGSYGLVATVVIKGTPITANTGSVTTAAALVVDGTTTGATNNYSIWAAGGNIRFDSLAGTGSRMVVASATGVLSAVANPVTGTGTINYIPKFTATGSTIGDSAIYSDGSSVRINTTAVHNNFTGELIVASSGNANLEVRAATFDQASIQLTQGTSDSSTSPRVEIFNSGNFGIVVYKPGVVSSNYVLYYDTESVTNRKLYLQTEGTARLTINENGSSEFSGTLTVPLLYSNQHIYFGMSTGADYYVRTPNIASSSTGRRGLMLSNGATNDLKVYAGGNQTLGNWTEGDNTLVIGTGYSGGGGSAETILFHSTGIGNMLALSAANSIIYSYLPINGTSASFSASVTTPAGFYIDTNTYLYEGMLRLTDLVGKKNILQLQASSSGHYITSLFLTGGSQQPIYISAKSTAGQNVIFNTDGTTTFSHAITGTSATFSGTINAASTNSQIKLSGGTTDGFVGISTSTLYITDWATATKGLTINLTTGAATFSGQIIANNTSQLKFESNNETTNIAYANIVNTSGFLRWGIEGSTGNGLFTGTSAYSSVIGTVTNTSLHIATQTNVRMTITGGGNVGIGETNPGVRLHVVASGAGIATFASSSANGGWVRFARNTSTIYGYAGSGYELVTGGANTDMALTTEAGNLLFATDQGKERMRVTNGGNVGIGNTNPGYKLDVSLPSGSNGQIIRMNRSGGAYGWGLGIDSNSLFSIYDNGGSSHLLINSSGYVFMPYLTSGSGIDDLGWWGSSSGSWNYNGMLMRISSSARYKKNIRDIEIDTTKIFELRTISYENNELTATDGLTSFGLLAEDVAEKIPMLATYNEDGLPEGVQYKMLSVLLLEEMKKMKSEIYSLKNN